MARIEADRAAPCAHCAAEIAGTGLNEGFPGQFWELVQNVSGR